MAESRDISYGIQPDGFRLPNQTRVGRVQLQVADLGRSLEYYESVLGLRVLVRSADRADLVPASDDRILVELRERRGARPAPRRGTFGLFHFAILLPDRVALGRFLRHALGRGVVSGVAHHAVSESIYLTDPDGLGIEVYADRPRSEWRAQADRQPRARRGSRREALLELLRQSDGLSRGEILERMGLKGDKSGAMSVSNALTALTKSNQVHREGRKYRAAA